MVRVGLETLVMGNIPGSSIMVLKPLDEADGAGRALPICIGMVEAAAIGKALRHEKSARPMTHALIGNILTQLGGTLDRVEIDRVRGTVFYATMCITRGSTTVKIDARPSDAVACALRAGAAIYVDEDVMAAAAFPSWVNTAKEQQEVEIEEFHSFVESLSPSDFV